jgi:hypothetical protein
MTINNMSEEKFYEPTKEEIDQAMRAVGEEMGEPGEPEPTEVKYEQSYEKYLPTITHTSPFWQCR